eukprot:g3650.t1
MQRCCIVYCASVRSDAAPPAKVYERLVETGAKKAKLPFLKAVISSFFGGAYIALGGLLCLTVGGSCPGLVQSNPGLAKIITGVFGLPFGLLLVLLTGVELFTGNTAVVTAAVLEEEATVSELLTNWFCSFLGNFLGALAIVYFLSQCGIANINTAQTLAVNKTSLSFFQALVRGVLANWLVCLAIWSASAASSLPGKLLGVMMPISSFVAMGFEHSVANMFLIPFGIFSGASVSFHEFLLRNLVPVTLGNILGGAVLVATFGSIMFGKLGRSKLLN